MTACDTRFELNTGAEIPALGLGTWQAQPDELKSAVFHAIKVGYRHIDAALCYKNETEVGQGIKEAIDAGLVTREDLFVTTKLWMTYYARVEEGLEESLANLGLDYVDLYLMHWPLAMNHQGNDQFLPKLEDGSFDIIRSHSHVTTWKSMEKLVETDKVRAIGVSNYSVKYLGELLDEAAKTTIVPAVNQIENHPSLRQQDVVDFCDEHGIHTTAYSPLGSTGCPMLTVEPIVAIAQKHQVAAATVLLSYHLTRGSSVVVKSVTPARIEANRADLIQLDREDMATLTSYSDRLKAEGKLKRFFNPSFGVSFGFPDNG